VVGVHTERCGLCSDQLIDGALSTQRGVPLIEDHGSDGGEVAVTALVIARIRRTRSAQVGLWDEFSDMWSAALNCAAV
jgi:hypothetical protein